METTTKYILNNYVPNQEGISDEKAVSIDKVLSEKTIKEAKGAGHGKTLDEIQVQLDFSTETWYALYLWYAGGDDADDWVYLFDDKEKAIKNYNDFY